MQFAAKKSRSFLKKEPINDYENGPFLQMYTIPPTDSISLQEFEELAIERVKGIFFFKVICFRNILICTWNVEMFQLKFVGLSVHN